jgi:hypothetical protein
MSFLCPVVNRRCTSRVLYIGCERVTGLKESLASSFHLHDVQVPVLDDQHCNQEVSGGNKGSVVRFRAAYQSPSSYGSFGAKEASLIQVQMADVDSSEAPLCLPVAFGSRNLSILLLHCAHSLFLWRTNHCCNIMQHRDKKQDQS